MNALLNNIDKWLAGKAGAPVFTNVTGLSRSLLAAGTLLTLLANPVPNLLYLLPNGNPASPVLLEQSLRNRLNFFLLLGHEQAWIMKWAAIVVLLLVISGFLIRVSAILHAWVAWSFMLFSSAIDDGDQIASNLALLFIPVCLADNRRNHWDAPREQPPYNGLTGWFFLQLMRAQVAVIYFHAAAGKFPVTEWADGTAVYYWFNNGAFGLPGYLHALLDGPLSNRYFVALLTYGAVLFELTLFLCLTMPVRYRQYFLPPALLFHFFIILAHGIFSFFFSMAAALCIYLPDYHRPIQWAGQKKGRHNRQPSLYAGQ